MHEHFEKQAGADSRILTIRSHTGLSGDILLTGMAALLLHCQGLEPDSEAGQLWLDGILGRIMPSFAGSVSISRVLRNGIGAYLARVDLPCEHEHRNLGDITDLIKSSSMNAEAARLAISCFEILARAEGRVHGKPARDIHFHEVGALDSILDICGVCEMFVEGRIGCLITSPLPMADGLIACAHGEVPAPAPAVLELLPGFEVAPFNGALASGELVTPTAIALLRALGAKSQGWPAFRIEATALVYGQKFFADAVNGVIFALGSASSNIAQPAAGEAHSGD